MPYFTSKNRPPSLLLRLSLWGILFQLGLAPGLVPGLIPSLAPLAYAEETKPSDNLEETLLAALNSPSESLTAEDERKILEPVDAALQNPSGAQTLADLFLVLSQTTQEGLEKERRNLPMGQLVEWVAAEKKLPKFISHKRIAIRLEQSGKEALIPFGAANHEKQNIFSPATQSFIQQGLSGFELQYSGVSFLKIHLKAYPKSIGFFGKYLVFLVEEDFQANGGLQNLYFVDLEAFQNNLGKESLPIFRLPVPTSSELSEITRNPDGSLQVGELKLTRQGLDSVNQIWLDLFSFQVSSLDAEQLAEVAVQLANEVDTQLADADFALRGEGLSAMAAFQPAAAISQKIVDTLKGIRNKVVGIDSQKKAIDQVLEQDPEAKKIIQEVQNRRKSHASLYQKFSRAMGYLSLPQSDQGVSRIKSALAFAAGGLLKRKENQVLVDGVSLSAKAATSEGVKQLLHHPYVRAGSVAVGAALVSSMYPEETARLSLQALLLGRDAATLVFGKLGDLGYLASFSAKSVFKWNNVYQQYLADGKYVYFFTGLSGLLGTYFTARLLPRYIVTLYRLGKDTLTDDFQRTIDQSSSFISGIKKYLVDRETKARADYLSLLGKQSADRQAQDVVAFTQDDTDRVRAIQRGIEENERYWKLPYGRDSETGQWKAWKFKIPNIFKRASKSSSDAEVKDIEVQSFAQAVKHLLFGAARSFDAVPAFVKTWNGWFLFRAFVLHPRVVAPYLLYSKFYEVMFSDRTVKEKFENMRVPSFWNGGRRTRYEQFILWLKDYNLISSKEWTDAQQIIQKVPALELPNQDPPRNQTQDMAHLVSEVETLVGRPIGAKVWSHFRALVNGQGIRQRLDQWESSFAEQEGLIHQEALRLSWFRTLDYLKTPVKRREWIDAGVPSSLASLNQAKLTLPEKRFFHIYFNELSAKSIRKMLEQRLEEAGVSAPSSTIESDSMLKQIFVGINEVPKVNPESVRTLVRSVDGESLSREISDRAQKLTFEKDALTDELTRVVMNFLRTDKNKQVKRVLSVNRMLESPDAVLRATLALNADSTIGKVMELMFTFLALSSIDSGFLQPFFPGDWFTDRAFFGFNRYVFLSGMMANSVLGVFSGPWLKLQQDEQHEGQFGNIPEGADRNRSFVSWFGKQLFKNPENTIYSNQMHNNRIIWANMKPALVYMAVINYLTLGVVLPLDPYFTGYLLSYFGFYSGLLMWIDQGMELANSGYDAKFFPKELLSHPEAQDWITKRRGKRRMLHTVWNQSFEAVVYQLISVFANTGTPRIGPRSFSTLLFGTPLGVASKGLAIEAEKAVEGTVLSGCINAFDEAVFNRGNPDIKEVFNKP